MDSTFTPIEILIVEDNMADVRLVKEVLDAYRIVNRIEWATDGERAMRIIRERKPNLVILDMFLPKKSGKEILEEVRANPELDRVHIVIMSGSIPEMEMLKEIVPGADAFIKKPIDLESLSSVVSQIDRFAVGILHVLE